MSQSDSKNTDSAQSIHSQLAEAKNRHLRIYIILFLAVGMLGLGLYGLLVFSNGTPITVMPGDAAEVAKTNVAGGVGFVLNDTAYSLAGHPTVVIQAQGFRLYKRKLTASEVGKNFTATLSELPGLLKLSASPSSSKTKWFIDNKLVFVGDALEREIFSGKYEVKIDNPYNKPLLKNIDLGRGETYSETIQLDPIEGSLELNSKPRAEISINGEAIGKGPIRVPKPGGKYKIELSLPGYNKIQEEIEVRNDMLQVLRNYILKPEEGYLTVDVSPKKGVLLVNGKQVKASTRLTARTLEKNKIVYSKPGFYNKTLLVSVSPGKEKKVRIALKKELGNVEISSKPTADVYVSGKLVGVTPYKAKLSAVPHRIELRKKDYRTVVRVVEPSGKNTQKVDIVLETELEARLRETKGEFSNSIGIELKLYKPKDTFDMGAPRHEKGQRANEFMRKVKLSRPFIISKHETTKEQYAKFAKKDGSGEDPVVSISWMEAAKFCNWLSAKEGLSAFYGIQSNGRVTYDENADGYRLPTEAEWEWLARKVGKKSQTKFTWGDESVIPKLSGNIADENAKGSTAFYVPGYDDGFSGVAPVGSFPAEPSGLHDQTGNVSEWVHDIYSLVPPDPGIVEQNPLGRKSGDSYVVKGSNWQSGNITELRAAYREGAKAGSHDIGFRVARYLY